MILDYEEKHLESYVCKFYVFICKYDFVNVLDSHKSANIYKSQIETFSQSIILQSYLPTPQLIQNHNNKINMFLKSNHPALITYDRKLIHRKWTNSLNLKSIIYSTILERENQLQLILASFFLNFWTSIPLSTLRQSN